MGMKSDSMLRDDVIQELEWNPSVNTTDIGVAIKDGIVTLTGTVDSFPRRWAAEEATQRISGVRGIANEIQVKLTGFRMGRSISQPGSYIFVNPKGSH